LKEQPVGGSATLQPERTRRLRRQGFIRRGARRHVLGRDRAQPEPRVFHEAPFGSQIEPQTIAFDHVASLLEPHIAFGVELFVRRLIAEPVGGERLVEPPQLYIPFSLDLLFGTALQPVGFHENRGTFLARRLLRQH
jgi:hypothetical protein